MKKRYKRQPAKWKKVYFKKGKNIISENYITFLKKYKIHAIIKILRSDFKLIKKNMTRFTHFNAQNTIHKPGKNYPNRMSRNHHILHSITDRRWKQHDQT